jgi:hypothetical protein
VSAVLLAACAAPPVSRDEARSGRNAGDLHLVHAIAIDSRCNVYTGESDDGKRVQKFKPKNGARK